MADRKTEQKGRQASDRAYREWAYPDYSKATPEQLLDGLLAMRKGQADEALIRADRDIPKREEDQ